MTIDYALYGVAIERAGIDDLTDEELFDAARRLTSAEQAEFLEANCEDTAQASRLHRLLAADQAKDSLLDTTTNSPDGDPAGQVIPRAIGDFEISRELGRGGMGVVYEAQQKSLRRKVALKVLSSGLGLSSKAILRFRREAEAAGKLHHTNIVPIYMTGEDSGIHFYAMELIDGPSLDQVIRARKDQDEVNEESLSETALRCSLNGRQETGPAKPGGLPTDFPSNANSSLSTSSGTTYFDEVATVIADVAEALEHAHEHGVIHRDIKPSNLLLGPDGRLSINDFGLARVLEQPGMTVSGEFVGSPLYMSPEQITAGRVQLDHRTDIYSLGATLYELLTHQPPFPGDTRDQVLSQVLHKEPVSSRRLNRRIPLDLDTICMKAIDKNPERRYQTAGQLADDLRKFVNRYAISARRTGPVTKTFRYFKRNPTAAVLALFLLLAVVVGAVGYRVLSEQEKQREIVAQQMKREQLREKQQLQFAYSVSGAFAQADRLREEAAGLGATETWLRLAKSQTEMYRGNYSDAFRQLELADTQGGYKTSISALKAIALLFTGDERKHAQDLLYISRALSEGILVAESSEDYLYLAMAYMFADPERSLGFLRKTETGLAYGKVHDLIRCHVYLHLADRELDTEQAVNLAEEALAAANSIRGMLTGSPLAVGRVIEAETIAAKCFARANLQKRSAEAFARAHSLAQQHEHPRFQMSEYLLLDETETDDTKVSAYLLGLPSDNIDYYTRTYRMIDFMRQGNADLARVDQLAFERDQLSKESIVLLARLFGNPTGSERTEIKDQLRASMKATFNASQDDVMHIEFFWAACCFLEMKEERRECEKQMQLKAALYAGTYNADLMAPLIELTRGESPSEIEQKAGSRRRLTFALFGLGVEALSNGRKTEAKRFFDRCAKEGVHMYYVCQFSRAMSSKLKAEPNWPTWISSDD